MDPHLILVIVIVTALAFDFTNGFHDTANVVATSISTGAAVIMAASHFGFPLSITHVINGGIMGSGIAKRLSAVHWGGGRRRIVDPADDLPDQRRDLSDGRRLSGAR